MLEANTIVRDEPAVKADLFKTGAEDQDKRASAWLGLQLKRMEREGSFAELDISCTPALARALMALNKKNRRLRQGALGVLKRALAEKRWINTGHPVVISWDSLLQDGQHRLTMIAETGIPAVIDIRFGVDPDAFAVTDSGSKRSASDIIGIGIEGVTQETTVAAAARVLMSVQRGNSGVHYSYPSDPTNDVILAFVRENPLVIEAARVGHSSGRALKCTSAAVAAAAFLIASTHGIEVADEFFAAARLKLNLTSTRHPLKTLEKVIEGGSLRTSVQVCAALILAFNRRRQNRSATQPDLIWAAGTPFPVVAK